MKKSKMIQNLKKHGMRKKALKKQVPVKLAIRRPHAIEVIAKEGVIQIQTG